MYSIIQKIYEKNNKILKEGLEKVLSGEDVSSLTVAIKELERVAKLNNPSATKKAITALIKDDKTTLQQQFTEKVNMFKEEMTEKYFEAKQNLLDDYPIFMAIAEDIGYDATGRETKTNELIEIGIELQKFITHINKTEK